MTISHQWCGETFAKPCLVGLVVKWSSNAVHQPRNSLAWLAWSYFALTAHNPEVEGSNPSPATRKKQSPFGWLLFCPREGLISAMFLKFEMAGKRYLW